MISLTPYNVITRRYIICTLNLSPGKSYNVHPHFLLLDIAHPSRNQEGYNICRCNNGYTLRALFGECSHLGVLVARHGVMLPCLRIHGKQWAMI